MTIKEKKQFKRLAVAAHVVAVVLALVNGAFTAIGHIQSVRAHSAQSAEVAKLRAAMECQIKINSITAQELDSLDQRVDNLPTSDKNHL